MRVLVVNAGSSSTKASVLDGDRVLGDASLPPAGDRTTVGGVAGLLRQAGGADAVGHRVVHGGPRFQRPVLLGPEVERDLAALADLAPLHNGPALRLVDAVAELEPDLPAVACFDTAFFAALPPAATTYALPAAWRQGSRAEGALPEGGIRRYGFHGLSHARASRRAADLVRRPAGGLRVVTAHIGSGASLAAVAGGRPLDTTMGFTPLEGLVMATRSGSVDPGALTFLLRHTGTSPGELEDALERRSGLAGLCGTGDLRQVLERVDRGDHEASLAWAVYLHRLRREIAAMAASMGGVDVVAFTGGAGEASARLRAEACAGLEFLGLQVDPQANAGEGDRVVSPASSPASVVVVRAREDLEIARSVRETLA